MAGFIGERARRRRRNFIFFIVCIFFILIIYYLLPLLKLSEVKPSENFLPSDQEIISPKIKTTIEELELKIFDKEQKIIFRNKQIEKFKDEIKILSLENQKLLESVKGLDNVINLSSNNEDLIKDQIKNQDELIKKIKKDGLNELQKLKDITSQLKGKNKNLLNKIEKYKVDNNSINKEFKSIFSKNLKLKNLNEKNNKKIEENITNYHKIAKVISELRIKEAFVLEKKISSELKKLGMNDCDFKINITTDNNQINKNGYDNVSFLIKTNKKSKLLPLSEIASGGELSRLSLVIQLETRSNNDCETMIFDEIDTGIGGATAEILGNHLAKLSDKTQVLCVTHLAQIAAKAKHHYLVSKDKELSSTELMYLDNNKRVEELARMIGGIELTDKTLQFAKELIS